jgi:pyruvate carboxylase subunit B
MRTEDMLPICDKLDKVGYWSLEVWGGATFDACVRFLKEDPWERLRQLREALPNTQLQMLLRGQNLLGYRHYSDDVVRSFVQKAADNGMDIFRIFDAMNDIRNLKVSVEAVNKAGKHAQGAICYTTSPVHTTDQFVELALGLQKMGCDSIAIKDMAGLLIPAASIELVSALVDTLEVPVFVHSHATSGLSSMCQFEAVQHGAAGIDTAISALAGGTSHAPTESMVAAFHNTPFDSGLDLKLLQDIGFYFYEIRKKYHQFESEYTGVDTRVQTNQVPGGMISNLANQLKQQEALSRMQEVLEEIPRVRADLGYPPLVTPTSQIVGTQAVLNVINGERYKTITNEVKLYLKGRYGKAPGEVNEAVRRQAIGNEEVIEVRPADLLNPELDMLRDEIGELAKSDEDVLTYAMFPELGREFLQQREDGTLAPELLEPPREDVPASPMAATEFNVTLHGETYHIKLRGTGYHGQAQRPYYLNIDGLPEEILVDVLDEVPIGGGGNGHGEKPTHAGKRPKATEPGHVSTSMPGTIVDVLVEVGEQVKAGAPVLITEAMKMETEVQAPIDGVIKAVNVSKGESVTPEEALIEIEAE